MTEPRNPADVPENTTPEPGSEPSPPSTEAPPPTPASSSPWEPAVVPPPIENSTPTDATAAYTVSKDRATFPGEAPTARRRNGVRWAIALGGVAIVIAVTVAVLAFTAGKPNTSVAVGYMPNDSVIYGEYRFDLPGDQRAKLANFMSGFPGFSDTSTFDAKLDEALDQLLAAATQNNQRWTTDIKPWFGGEIAFGSRVPQPADLSAVPASSFGGSLFVVTITNHDGAVAWLKKVAPDLTETDYNGATILSGSGDQTVFSSPASFAVTDKVIIAGDDADVRASVDSKGQNKLAEDAEFKAAFGTAKGDYVAFSFIDYRSLIQSTLALTAGAGSGLDTTTVDDELIAMIPPWFASVARFEDDSLVGESAFQSIDFGFDAKNRKGTLAGHAPAGSILYAESHDIGAALTALLERFRQMPELREAFGQIDQSAGMIGGLDGAIGWWGDTAVVVSKAADASVGGGILIAPTDADKAKRFMDTIRSFIILGGRGAGVEIRDEPHGNATISTVDFTAAVGTSGALPPGIKAEIQFAVTPEVVVFGYGDSFVSEVLDASGASSLAGSQRFQDLVKRVGEENIGVTFVDVAAIRALVEPLVKDAIPADQWTFYEREITPYLKPLDAIVSSSVKADGLDHLVQSIVVSKPAQ